MIDQPDVQNLYSQLNDYEDSVIGTDFPLDKLSLIKNSRLLGLCLPGETLSFDTPSTKKLLQLLKKIGKGNLPAGRIYEGHISALFLIYLFGKDWQQERWYNDVANSEMLFGVWNTQDVEGLYIHDLGNGSYRLEGCKTFCSGAENIDRPLVTGQLVSPDKNGWQMCIIPTERVKPIIADSSFWNPMGMQASISYKMDFTGIILTDADLLGEPGMYYDQPWFGGGAIRFAAVQLGGAEAIFEEAHQFLKNAGRTFDPFQRARIAEITHLIETGNLWLDRAGENFDLWTRLPDSTEKVLAYANMTRAVVEDICLRTMQLAERSVGLKAFMKPNRMEAMHRDLTTYLRQPAPDSSLTSIGEYVLNQPTTGALWIIK